MLLAARLAAWARLPHSSEDAYITFRFARNLATGGGLVYNPGEKVMGFSSPIWAVWSAVGHLLLHDPIFWSRVTSLAADVVTLVCLGRLLERHAGRAAAWCFTFFFAAWPYFSAVSMSGMESSTMLALIALGATLVERRSSWAGPTLGVLALMRPEGVASAAVLALGARTRDRLVAGAVLLAGLAVLTLEYGSPLPHSLFVKASVYGTPGPWKGKYWWDWLVPFSFGEWPSIGDLNLTVPLTVLWSAGCVAALVPLWRARRTGLALAIGACLTVWAGYVALGVAYFYWYLAVPLAGLAALSAVGLPRLLRGRAVYGALILSVLGSWTVARILYEGRANNESANFARVAGELRSVSRPGDKVMLEPIGMVGWVNPLVIIDEVGLVSPGVAERRLKGPGWYTDIVAARRPEWLVVRRSVLGAGQAFAGRGAPFRDLAERDSLLARYQEIENQPQDDEALVILRRR